MSLATQAQGVAHSQGNLQLSVGGGGFGSYYFRAGQPVSDFDPLNGDSVYGCVYPRGSYHHYLRADLHIGAVVGRDTLVSNYWEMSSEGLPYVIETRNRSKAQYSPKARSELDITETIFDNHQVSFTVPCWDLRPHISMGLAITQRSMSWSGASVDDFVMLEYSIANRGDRSLTEVYVGFETVAAALNVFPAEPDQDNLLGWLSEYEFEDRCPQTERLNLAYVMDNDGDPVAGQFTDESLRAAVGIMLLGSSSEIERLNFNWWDVTSGREGMFGPRRTGTLDNPFRPISEYLGYPCKDVNQYYLMSHPEVDYDQLFTAADHSPLGWLPPPAISEMIASGGLGRFLLSFGPFSLGVNEHFDFTIAVVGGDNVHNDPLAHFDPYHPQSFYDQLDFSELATNARWAQWVYDNPGYDTDSDGYCGEFRICEGDTIWYKGDGVPDFRGNTPPPAPFTRILTEPSKITIRWNGYFCETSKDPFSNLVDFEGYRVYCGLDTRRASLSILSSYDRENFFRLKWHDLGSGYGKWLNDEPPYSLDELQTIHNNPNLDPHRYTRDYPLFEGDSVFYFQMVDANLDDLSSPLSIHKVYPNATDPGTDTTLWTEDDITHDYDRPLPKYYEYEYVLNNLMPTVPYFISVTSFDFGYAGGRGNLPPDESNPLNNLTECYAQTSADSVEAHNLDVYVYPNPYRVDADYHERGYENRAGRIIPDRARLLHFGNLPNVCMISIFSLDGDLIGKKDHNFPEGGPEAMHDWWNLVSRSGLAVESGLYYWVVESATRSQIGKFVIIK